MLLRTKLFIPPASAQLVARPQLVERLNAGLSGKLTLVAAPAGFGKTTLITSWIHDPDTPSTHRFAWYSLDEDDNDLQQFFRYVTVTLDLLCEDDLLLSQLVAAEQQIEARTWARALVNDALTIDTPFVLVLDDYHVIHSAEINTALTYLLDHMPPHMHLVLTTRADPNLPIARLRARRQMTEIRAADLRLDSAETRTLLHSHNLTDDQTATLNERTEGWIAGLQLAAIALQTPAAQRDPALFIDSFAGSHRFIIDYLTDEVLRGQPLEIESFLLQTSILERFSVSLCEALLPDSRTPVADLLQQIERANLFLVPLDEHRDQYRYHHLFADLLRQRLAERFSAEQITDLHRRAIAWLCHHNLIEEATHHAAIIDEWETVTTAAAPLGRQLRRNGNHNRLHALLNRIPDPVLRGAPQLAPLKAWLCYSEFDIDGVQTWLAVAETLTDDPGHTARTVTLRALHTLATGDVAKAIALAEAESERLGEGFSAEKGGLLTLLGNGYDILGRHAERGQAFTAAVRHLERGEHWSALSSAMTLLIRHHWSIGDLQTAWMLSQQFMERTRTDERLQHGSGAQVSVFHAFLIFERNEFEQLKSADEQVAEALELTRLTMAGTATDIWMIITLALLRYARGDLASAHNLAAEADQLLTQMSPGGALFGYYDFLIALQLLLGQTERARRWIDTLDTMLAADTDNPIAQLNTVHRAWFLLLTDPTDLDSLHESHRHLQTITEQATGYVALLAPAVLALVQRQTGDHAGALHSIALAVERAAPQQWVSVFHFPGTAIADLLRELLPTTPHRAFCERVLQAVAPQTTPKTAPKQMTVAADGHLIEPLSDRELEVLQLVAAGHSNRDIANRLYLAVGTVKRHLSNINGKLHAGSRTQAVARARELDFL